MDDVHTSRDAIRGNIKMAREIMAAALASVNLAALKPDEIVSVGAAVGRVLESAAHPAGEYSAGGELYNAWRIHPDWKSGPSGHLARLLLAAAFSGDDFQF